jgi:uncharacterized protein
MERAFQEGGVAGWLHTPDEPNGDALVITHGAGSNANAPVVLATARAFEAEGYLVLRCNLPFRQQRPTGPPFPAMAARDREGLREAVRLVRPKVTGRVFLGGHSYGGRQASMLAAAEPAVANALLLLSYPLHPPQKPDQLRTAHFPDLRTTSLFVHGTRDPFGSIAEMEAALAAIPGRKELFALEGAGHDLRPVVKKANEIMARLKQLVTAGGR